MSRLYVVRDQRNASVIDEFRHEHEAEGCLRKMVAANTELAKHLRVERLPSTMELASQARHEAVKTLIAKYRSEFEEIHQEIRDKFGLPTTPAQTVKSLAARVAELEQELDEARKART